MDSSEESLKFALVMLLSAVALAVVILRRYGSVWRTILNRLGRHWPRFIACASIATMVLWMMYWAFVGREQRAELQRIFQESAPWGLVKPADRTN
ncbi:MAG: hypothetical protein O3C34_17395 [Proteobacteria bacterium]|nr:hypothetical protein [Pseudomonadota bacterium]